VVRRGLRIVTTRRDDLAVREQLAGVVEEDDAVAQKAPALFGVARDDARCVTVLCVSPGTRWEVPAHRVPPLLEIRRRRRCGAGLSQSLGSRSVKPNSER